jgi:hypothetical protein
LFNITLTPTLRVEIKAA